MVMSTQRRRWLARAVGWLAITALGGGMRPASARVPAQADKLILTLEKGRGLSRVVESITPAAIPGTAAGSGSAIYDVVGDLRMQFWFVDEKLPSNPDALRGPAEVRAATFAELRTLGLQPEQAVRKALANMGRMWFGRPMAATLLEKARAPEPRPGGIIDNLNVVGLPIIGGSWMMDRALWTEVAAALGPIVVTASRQALAYAPLRDGKAMEWLQRTHAENVRYDFALSRQLYIFEKDRWAVMAKQTIR
jgi:hypothetical protein